VHGVHGCVLENPSLAQTKDPAEVLPSDFDRAERALAIQPRRENLELSKLPGTRVQFASVEAMTKAGVDVEPVERRAFTETVSVAGEVVYDATQMALVSPAADGVVRQVKVNVGDWVSAGDVLAVVDSQKVGELKSDLLSALLAEDLAVDQLSRFEKLAPSGAIPGRKLLEGKSELQQATVAVEQAIRGFVNLGLQVDLDALRSMSLNQSKVAIRRIGMEQIETINGSENLIAVVAPLEGRVVNRDAVIGEVVDRGSLMFRIADTRSVWLDLRVPAEEASLAKIGLPIRYRPDGSSREHRGEVTWISSDVDPQTRTVRVRAELANDDGELRNESFGHGEIVLRDETDAIAVPGSAIQWDGENSLVFVRDAKFFDDERPKFFIARSVRTGVSQDGFTEIIAGVLPGEVVATSGSDVLRAQLLKNNLGAGCTCGH
jgi:multidrug efflux pump subunit AcrA (membrane-fusion protein)